MVGRSSEVSLSKYDNIIIETVKDNNGQYCVVVQGIDRKKTVPFRRYIFILIEDTYYINGIGRWRTCLC